MILKTFFLVFHVFSDVLTQETVECFIKSPYKFTQHLGTFIHDTNSQGLSSQTYIKGAILGSVVTFAGNEFQKKKNEIENIYYKLSDTTMKFCFVKKDGNVILSSIDVNNKKTFTKNDFDAIGAALKNDQPINIEVFHYRFDPQTAEFYYDLENYNKILLPNNQPSRESFSRISDIVDISEWITRLGDLNIETVEDNIKPTLEVLKNVFNKYCSLNFFAVDKKEGLLQGFVFGSLLFNHKVPNKLECYVEHSSGSGRSDVKLLSQQQIESIPIVIELKYGDASGTDPESALKQCINKGYAENLFMRSKSKQRLLVGFNPSYLESVQTMHYTTLEVKGLIKKLSETAPKLNSLVDELKYLYYTKLSDRRHILNVLRGLSTSAFPDMSVTVFIKEVNIFRTIFELRDNKKDIKILVLDDTVNYHKLRSLKPLEKTENIVLTSDPDKVSRIYKLEVNTDKEIFEEYCNIQRLKKSKISLIKDNDNFLQVDSIKAQDIYDTLTNSKSMQLQNNQKHTKLFEPLNSFFFKFKSFIHDERDFQEHLKGIFMNVQDKDQKIIKVGLETSTSRDGRSDLILVKDLDERPVVIETKYNRDSSDASGELKHSALTQAKKYNSIRCATKNEKMVVGAMIFNTKATKEKEIVDRGFKIIYVDNYSPSKSQPRDAALKANPQNQVASCSKKLRRRKRMACSLLLDYVKKISPDFNGNIPSKTKVDSDRFLKVLKNSKDQTGNDFLVKFVSSLDKGNILGKNRYLAKKVIQAAGYEGYIRNENVKSSALRRPKVKAIESLKYKSAGLANAVITISSINGIVETFEHGSEADKIKTVGAVGWSFVFQPIESVLLKRGLNNVIAAGFKTGAKGFAKMALSRGFLGIAGNVFDIYDIYTSSISLADCRNRICTAKEKRDLISSITFSSLSLVTGILFVAHPLLGLASAVIIMAASIIYNRVSLVIEFKEKYNTNDFESIIIFFNDDLPEPILRHIRQYEAMNNSFTQVWQGLETDETEHMYAYATGLGYITGPVDYYNSSFSSFHICKKKKKLHVTPEESVFSSCQIDFDPPFTKIEMDRPNNSNKRNLFRVLPEKMPENVTILCYPKFDPTSGIGSKPSEISTALFNCEHAFVISNKSRSVSNRNFILFNLNDVYSGLIQGHNVLQNYFLIFNGQKSLTITGGNNTKNYFIFNELEFYGKIKCPKNSTNIFDLSRLETFTNNNYYEFQRKHYCLTLDISSLQYHARLYAFHLNLQLEVPSGILHGREKKCDIVHCRSDLSKNITINSQGGFSEGKPDETHDCKNVILSPFTNVIGKGNGYVIYISQKKLMNSFSKSVININGTGLLIFQDINILLRENIFEYSSKNNTLTIKTKECHPYVCMDYHILIRNFLNESTLDINFIIMGSNNYFLYLDSSSLFSSKTLNINKFHLRYGYKYQNFLDDSQKMSEIKRYVNNYSNLTITLQDDERVAIFGSDDNDLIELDHKKFLVNLMGSNGSDIYVLTNTSIISFIQLNNYATDKKIDFFHFLEVDREFKTKEEDLVLNGLNTTVHVLNFFKEIEFQHLLITTSSHKVYIPVLHGNLLWRVFYSTDKTLHFLDENFDETNGVVPTCGRNLEMYWHYENLLLINSCEWPSTVVIENYFLAPHKWLFVSFYLWCNESLVFEPFDLPLSKTEIADYDLKIQNDYENLFQVYKVDCSQDWIIEHNQNSTDKILHKGDQIKFGIISFTDVSLPQIDVFFEEKDLVFHEKECQTHIYVRNWDKNELFRISDLEFDVSSTSLKIEGLTEFDSSSLDQIQKRLKLAFENYNLRQNYNFEEIYKCLGSLTGPDELTYLCLGFKSIPDQIDFIQNMCSEKFDEEADESKDLYRFTKILINDMILSNFDDQDISHCVSALLMWKPALRFTVVEKNDIALLEMLLKTDMDLNHKNEMNETMLHVATKNLNFDAIKILVERGANINIKDKDDNSPYDISNTFMSKKAEEVRLYLKSKHNYYNRQLQLAITRGAAEDIYRFLSKGSDIECQYTNGDRPLHKAAWGKPEIVELLIDEGASVYELNENGERPLDIARNAEKRESEKILVAKQRKDIFDESEDSIYMYKLFHEDKDSLYLYNKNFNIKLFLDKFCALNQTLYLKVVLEVVEDIVLDKAIVESKTVYVFQLIKSLLEMACVDINWKIQCFLNIYDLIPSDEINLYHYSFVHALKIIENISDYSLANDNLINDLKKFEEQLPNSIFALGYYPQFKLFSPVVRRHLYSSTSFGNTGGLFTADEAGSLGATATQSCWKINQSESPYFYLKSDLNDFCLSTSFYHPDGHFQDNIKLQSCSWTFFTGLWKIESAEGNYVRFRNYYSNEYLSVTNTTWPFGDRFRFNSTLFRLNTTYRKIETTLWTVEEGDCAGNKSNYLNSQTLKSDYKKWSPSMAELYKSYKHDFLYSNNFASKYKAVKNELLFMAACDGRLDFITGLIQINGADVFAKNDNGETPLEVSKRCHKNDASKTLKRYEKNKQTLIKKHRKRHSRKTRHRHRIRNK